MKTLSLACTIAGRRAAFRVYVGTPAPGYDPLHFQAAWLREERGGILDPLGEPPPGDAAPARPASVAPSDEDADQD